ncbi:MAG: PD-(D/E)XK nuclease family protein [Ignavibacteria bacterium]|nr:PD-(D/E)XK nuclease family protein [Ignavibacteria bacterium]
MMNKSKSISEIYGEVKDFGLVITTDAPLATALNRNVDKPRLGLLAMTPRQLALKYGTLYFDKLYSKSELIIEITKQSRMSLKYVHQSIEKIFEIWNHTGLLESCEMFLTQEKEFLKYLGKLKTVEYAMENFDESFFGDKNIAVAGYELFNELDKQVLPRRNSFPELIKLMSEDEFTFDKTFLFNSTKDLISSVASIVNTENQNDVALIFNTDSELKNLFKSAFSRRGIKLELKSFLKEDISVSNYLSFIESSFNVSDHLVKDIFFTEPLFGISIDRKYSDFSLSGYISLSKGNKVLTDVFNLMKDIEKFTFSELYNRIEFLSGKNFSNAVRELLAVTETGDKKISEDRFNELKYFILNIDLETGKSKEGVLFVNAGNSAFVDRQITVFIGMDDSWTKLSTDKAYIDRAVEEKKNLEKFRILLSQGEERFYLAQNIIKNRSVIPCYYFNILTGRNIKKFDDEFFSPVQTSVKPSDINIKNVFPPEVRSPHPVMLEFISPSSLNSFYSCPKNYSYGKLTTQQERSYFLKGTLLHCFAEFCFNYPEYCKENFGNILDLICREYSGFLNEFNADTERSAFKVGMKVIMEFLDSMESEIKTQLEIEKGSKAVKAESNFLFKKTRLKKKYLNTEKWLKAVNAGISGKIDLTLGNTIIDYKSSKSGKSSEVLIREFNIERIRKDKADSANFQTIAYISGKREDDPDSKLKFIYLNLLVNYNDFIKGKADPEKSKSTVVYIPETFKRYMISQEFYDLLNVDILKELRYEDYRKIMLDTIEEIDFYDPGSLTDKLETKIHNHLIYDRGLTYKQFKRTKEETFRNKDIQALLKCMNSARKGSAEFPFIYKDDADNFVKFAKEKIIEINTFSGADFPNRPVNDLRSVCCNCDYLNICPGNKLLTADEN